MDNKNDFHNSVAPGFHDEKLKTICTSLSLQTSSFPFHSLDLSKNKLSLETWSSFVSKVLMHSPFLTTLILDECVLTDTKLEPLCKYLKGPSAKALSVLSVKGNKDILAEGWEMLFSAVCEGGAKLKEIRMDDCNLDDSKAAGIVEGLNKGNKIMPSIETLSINRCQKLSSEAMGPLFESLAKSLPTLHHLCLSDSELSDEKLDSLFPNFQKLPQLQTLEISGQNSISVKHFDQFLSYLLKMTSFSQLVMTGSEFDDKKMDSLCRFSVELLRKGRGKKVDLCDTLGFGMERIGMFVSKVINEKELLHLGLSGCEIDDSTLLTILKSLKTPTSLRHLDLSQNPLLSHSFEALFSSFPLNFPCLESLLLIGCSLSLSKIEFMASGLSKSSSHALPPLKFLDISLNKTMKEQDWAAFSKGVLKPFEASLDSLILADCEMKNQGLKGLLEGGLGQGFTKLRKLDLSKNWAITDTGLSELFNVLVLRGKHGIRELSLAECTLNDGKIKAIADALTVNNATACSLEKLDLTGNKSLTENGWGVLSGKLAGIEELKELNVFGCDLDGDGKVCRALAPLREGKVKLEKMAVFVNAPHLHEGLVALQQFLHQNNLLHLKLRFLHENLFLQVFWSPLNFNTLLKSFCFKAAEGKKTMKTVVFEPKAFLPFAFENPLMYQHEDIVLNEKMADFLQRNRDARVKKLVMVSYDPTANDSLLSKNEIVRIYDDFKNSRIDCIYLDYTYSSEKFTGKGELDILRFIRLLPPKSVSIKQGQTKITVNGLKAVFAMLYQNYNLSNITIDYDYDSFLNQGIAFSLREKLYRTFCRSRLLRMLRFLGYKLLTLFVMGAKHYKFSSDVILLDEYLKSLKFCFGFFLFFAGIYAFLSIFLPLYFILPCRQGLMWESHYIFAAFVAFSFLFEMLLFCLIYRKIRPLYLAFHNFAFSKRKTCKSMLKRRGLLFLYFVFSQLAHYDLYYKFSFIRITFECGQNALGIVAGVFMGLHMLVWLYNYLYLIIKSSIFSDSRELLLPHLHKFLDIAHLADFNAFFNTLDVVAPYHVIQLPSNCVMRTVAKNLAGLTINAKVFFFLVKFMFKNIPIVIVQIMFLFFRRENFGESDFLVIGSLVLSLLTFCIDFYKFMSVRPSTLYQGDFDELARRNRRKRNEWLKKIIDKRDFVLDE